MRKLECHDVYFSRNDGRNTALIVLNGVSVSIESGEFISIVGPSGCGKTTLLRLLAGLEIPSAGCITHNGKPVNSASPERGFVFQEPQLFPWATAAKNVEWGVRRHRLRPTRRRAIACQALQNVGLLAWADHFPHELSIGMCHRAAIARTLASGCDVILMDEPFAALDYQTRLLMQRFLVALWKKQGKTIILVTHQIDEACLADRVLLLSRKPSVILEDANINLPRPRDATSADYLQLRSRLAARLEAEVMAAAAEEQSWQAALKAEPVWQQNKARTLKQDTIRAV